MFLQKKTKQIINGTANEPEALIGTGIVTFLVISIPFDQLFPSKKQAHKVLYVLCICVGILVCVIGGYQDWQNHM